MDHGLRSGPHCIAIASGKGGVGKTCRAISIAASLGRRGVKVLLVDGDLGLANVDVQLGLMPLNDLGCVVERGVPLRGAITRYEAGCFDVLAGRAGSGALSALSSATVERLLLRLAELDGYEVILLDLAAGVDRVMRRMACWAHSLLVVATDEPTSLTDAYVALKLYLHDKGRLASGAEAALDARILVNQAASHAAGELTHATLSRVATNYLGFMPALAGIVRRDERMRDAIRGQVPLPLRYPVSAAAQDVERVVAGLLQSRCRTEETNEAALLGYNAHG